MSYIDHKETSSYENVKSITLFTNNGFDPCAYIRVRGPMRHLGINVIEGKENGEVYPERVSQGDLIVIQRDFARDFRNYEKIIKKARQLNKPVVYDLDDLLFHLPRNHPERSNYRYTESLLPIMESIIDAECVTVTTQNLKNHLQFINKNTVVLPNYFDDFLWKLRPPSLETRTKRPVIIGYMGTETHLEDIQYISPVLKELLNRYLLEIEIHFWGMKPTHDLMEFVNVKWHPSITYNYIDFANYFQNQSVDIFIAPLIDNLFNKSKSPLKYFEYSSLGAPTVYSNLDPFENIIINNYNGLLASNPDEWLNQLSLFIENDELRYSISSNAQKSIVENWLLSMKACQWKSLYGKILNGEELLPNNNATFSNLIKSLNNQYSTLIQNLKDENKIKDQTIQANEQTIKTELFELNEIKKSKLWRLLLIFREFRIFIFPINSRREKLAKYIYYFLIGQRTKFFTHQKKALYSEVLDINKDINCNSLEKHQDQIDIIICVHNALEDIKTCLDSIKKFTTEPFSLIIIDDGSDHPTKVFLENSKTNFDNFKLIRNDLAQGYTGAANIGIKESKAPFLILLNSDTIVGPEWIDRLYRAITFDKKTGIVGPLSNTASWQSIPDLENNGDWATNPLPPSISVEKMSKLISNYSRCTYPEVPLLNGFCLMIKKEVLDEIGYLDEENFGQGYGEEDDFNIRAGKAGWKKVIADDVYVYHAQSKSYSHEMRYKLSTQNSEKLAKKHGVINISNYVKQMNPNRILEGIRHRSRILFEREEILSKGNKHFNGKKILFVLPIMDAGGGANIILDESRALRRMGIDVQIYNFKKFKSGFKQSYPNLDVPVIYGNEEDLGLLGREFDAVIASANYSVKWLLPLQNYHNKPILGYYIQDYEPMMYPSGSLESEKAKESYTVIDNIKCFTKTNWNQDTLFNETGIKSDVVGISVNIDLYRPQKSIEYGLKPISIVAMIRPSSPYRNPDFTLSILKKISRKFGKNVDIWLFGTHDVKSFYSAELLDFQWKQLGKLNQNQVAALLSHADIFTDFSTYQAMGLTSLESLACGSSVLVPQKGGSKEFVQHKKNGIIVDTTNFQNCYESLEELISNDQLRIELQLNGSKDVVQYFPERAAYNILKSLFWKQNKNC
jgi:GT2 family glycosyltransferase